MSEKQLSFEGVMMIVNDNKWIKLKDIEKLSDFIQEQQAIIEAKDSLLSILAKENEQLKKEYKIAIDEMVTDYKKLEKENERLQKDIRKFN